MEISGNENDISTSDGTSDISVLFPEELKHLNEWRSLLEKNIDEYINGIHSRVLALIRGATQAYSTSVDVSRGIKYAAVTGMWVDFFQPYA